MNDGADHCANCGRARWTGERFCSSCGAEHPIDADAADVLDLDADVQQASGSVGRSGGRETLIGIGALAAVIALVAVLFTFGNNAAEELVSPDSPEQTAEPEPEPEPTLTPAPVPGQTLGPTGAALTTPVPGTVLPTITAVPAVPAGQASLVVDGISKAVSDLDLGDGWLVAIDDPRSPSVIDLKTGEVVTVASRFLSPRANVVLAGSAGLYLPTSANLVMTWSLVPWDGSEMQTAARFDNANDAFGREPGWYFLDDEVGPVIIHLLGDDEQMHLQALALETGESRRIALEDPSMALLGGLFFDFAGLRTPTGAMLMGNGEVVWRWTFNGGWEAIGEGAVRLTTDDSAVTVSCADPSDCVASLIDARTGEHLAELPGYNVNGSSVLWGQSAMISPDRSAIAQFSSRTSPTYDRPDVSIYDTATGLRRRIAQTDFNWWELIAWSPNSNFLIASGEAGIAAIDVDSDEVHMLTTQTSSSRGSGVQVALLRTIERSE